VVVRAVSGDSGAEHTSAAAGAHAGEANAATATPADDAAAETAALVDAAAGDDADADAAGSPTATSSSDEGGSARGEADETTDIAAAAAAEAVAIDRLQERLQGLPPQFSPTATLLRPLLRLSPEQGCVTSFDCLAGAHSWLPERSSGSPAEDSASASASDGQHGTAATFAEQLLGAGAVPTAV
jgi:hypothetical protein